MELVGLHHFLLEDRAELLLCRGLDENRKERKRPKIVMDTNVGNGIEEGGGEEPKELKGITIEPH